MDLTVPKYTWSWLPPVPNQKLKLTCTLYKTSVCNMRRKEIFWLIGTIVLVLILNMLILGIDGLKSDTTFNINIHETYFVIPNFHFTLLLGVLVFWGVYIIRALHKSFKNLTVNLILIISTILLILILNGISVIIENSNQLTSLSTNEGIGQFETKENGFSILLSVLFYIQILLLVFLTYCGFKTGQNYKRTE